MDIYISILYALQLTLNSLPTECSYSQLLYIHTYTIFMYNCAAAVLCGTWLKMSI